MATYLEWLAKEYADPDSATSTITSCIQISKDLTAGYENALKIHHEQQLDAMVPTHLQDGF